MPSDTGKPRAARLSSARASCRSRASRYQTSSPPRKALIWKNTASFFQRCWRSFVEGVPPRTPSQHTGPAAPRFARSARQAGPSAISACSVSRALNDSQPCCAMGKRCPSGFNVNEPVGSVPETVTSSPYPGGVGQGAVAYGVHAVQFAARARAQLTPSGSARKRPPSSRPSAVGTIPFGTLVRRFRTVEPVPLAALLQSIGIHNAICPAPRGAPPLKAIVGTISNSSRSTSTVYRSVQPVHATGPRGTSNPTGLTP